MNSQTLSALLLITILTPGVMNAQDNAEGVYALDSLAAALKDSGESWLPFLTVPTLRTGLYRLEKGSTDGQSPHNRDEVYYVIEGVARITIGEVEYTVKRGDVIFVKAHTKHQFHGIEMDLLLLVFFTEATE